VRRYWSGFLTSRSAFFHRRLPVALLKSGDGDGQDEFFFAVIVEFDHDIFFGARKHRAQAILGVFDLCALRKGRFASHKGGKSAPQRL